MKIILLGAGIQGKAAAYDLVQSPQVSKVVLVDNSEERLSKVAAWIKSSKVEKSLLDIENEKKLRSLVKGSNAILNSAPYEYCLRVTHAAIEERVSLVDLGGDTEVVRKQIALNDEAKRAGITVIPDCGVSPGITNAMVGHGMALLDFADEVWIRDGGLPQKKTPPLYYEKLFSIDVLINEYTGKTTAVRDSKIIEVDSLTEVEAVEFPDPIGKCEATHGMGMLSSLPWSFEGRIRNMDNKFVRYPGHLQFFQTLKQLGFLDNKKLLGNISARDISKVLLEKYLSRPDTKDIYVIKLSIKGRKNGRAIELNYSLLDYFDEQTGLSSMSRTTGFTASIATQMLACGEIQDKGVLPPEFSLARPSFFAALRKRGIQVSIPV